MNQIPKEFIEIAKELGLQRTICNEKKRNANKEFYSSNPEQTDFIGVLAEMLAAFELMKKGNRFTLNEMKGGNVIAEQDIAFEHNGKLWLVDVKATTTRIKRVPKRKFGKAADSGINAYWFFRISLKEYWYQHQFNTLEQVQSWQCVDSFGEEQYCKKFV